MKNKLFLALILIAFLVTGCFYNNLKKHLESIGFDCKKNICEKTYEYNDITDDYYHSSGNTYSFDLKNKTFHIGYYFFSQNDGKVSSNTGAYSYTYNWEDDKASVKNVVGNGTYQYNCNNNEIVFSPLFSWNVDDNCKWLDQNGEYYNQFLIQCNELDALCKDSSITYYEFINY